MSREGSEAERRLAFVAGATGYTGRAVVARLRSLGHPVIAHVRPGSARRDQWRARFEELGAELCVTPWEQAAMTESMKALRPSLVFALLGTTKARMRRTAAGGGDAAAQSYEAVDYGLTRLLMEAVLGAGLAPRFIYLSSAGVRAGVRTPYLAVRWRAEQELRTSGLPFTIARPSFITGPDRDETRPMERLGARATDGLLAVAGLFGAKRLRERYRSTTNTRLAAALVEHALDPASKGRVLESEQLYE